MSTTTTIRNLRFAEGIQYRDYVVSAYDAADKTRRQKLAAEGKTSHEIDSRMAFRALGDFPKIDPPKDRMCWGPWRYKKETLVLEFAPRDRNWWYEIDLERCGTSALMLDWIFQVSNKHTRPAEEVGYLIEALQDLLDPQANICTFGGDTRMDTTRYLLEETVENNEVL
jgi:hypothetical protein